VADNYRNVRGSPRGHHQQGHHDRGVRSVIAYSVAKGNPLGDVSNIVAALAVGLSTIISGFAASQGIQIPIINADRPTASRSWRRRIPLRR
jgi:hypothetical protein